MQMGNAVHDACEKLKQELISLAAQVKGGNPEWQLIQGRLCWGETSFSIGEIIRVLGGSGVLKCVGYHSALMEKESSFAGMDHWAPSAAAIDLEVNPGNRRAAHAALLGDRRCWKSAALSLG